MRWEQRLALRTEGRPYRPRGPSDPWFDASCADAELLYRILKSADSHFEAPGAGLQIADAAMVYLDRCGVPLTERTARRLVIVACLLALKVDDDECLSNAQWAACVGLTLRDLNRLERDFCAAVDWALWLHPPRRHSVSV